MTNRPANLDFVHLHNHSEYSLMDGAIRIKDLVAKVKGMGHTSVAMTDHTNMFGAIEFYNECKSADINPIIGCEIFHEGQEQSREALKDSMDTPGNDAFHLVLLAKSTKGYHSLMRVVSYGFLRSGSDEIPVVKEVDLEGDTEDLIALSGCQRGEFGRLVARLATLNPDIGEALKDPKEDEVPVVAALNHHVEVMEQRYGKDHYYIELIDNLLPAQKALIPRLVLAAEHFGLPTVASGDAHYIDSDFEEAHVVLTAIKNDLTMSKLRNRRVGASFHVLDEDEMWERFGSYPQAIANTKVIADQCNVELTFGQFFLPDFEIEGEDINDSLRRISKEGLEARFEVLKPMYGESLTKEKEKEYWDRLDYELETIIGMGFPGYFLIVQDFINWAKEHGIPVGPGRGSGAGSLVAYALKITDLDPIPLNLIFERFLNPERISMPDFDVDFCQSRRDEVIQYVTHRYGKANVAQITTFGKMKAKAALRDVGRVLEIGYSKVDRIAKLVPNELDIKLSDALDQEPRILEEAQKDPLIDQMIKTSLKIEGLSRHTSVHAAGVVISNGAMENFVPVYKSDEGVLITQYEMKNAEKVGLVKFDFLGLKTLSVVEMASQIIRRSQDPSFNIDLIDTEDSKVYQNISSGFTCGIFQLESSGMQALNTKLKPSCFEDIIAVVALFRPGPLGSGMVDDFIERKHGRLPITYLFDSLEPILRDTYGIILYQEQVQKIASVVANYSLGEADLLRRAMGKKKPEEMAKQKTRFLEGAKTNNIDPQQAEELFELMAKFAAYGFNKSHSAAYGLVSYQTAFLKTHYPAEFMAAIMTYDLDNTDKLTRYFEECKRLRFKIIPPDINQCGIVFDVPAKNTLSFALSAIKGLGTGPLEPIIKERDSRGPFKSLTDLAKRVNLQKVGKKNLELLNESGALDLFGFSRDAISSVINDMVQFSDNHHTAKNSGQGLLFSEDADESSGKPADWELLLQTKKFETDRFKWLLKEKKILGVFVSGHPVDLYKEDVSRFSKFKLKDVEKNVGEKNLPIVCFFNGYSERLTKSGKKMAYVQVEDETAPFEAVMFQNEIPDEFPKSSSIVVCYVNIKKGFDGRGINVRLEKIVPVEDVRNELTRFVNLRFDFEKSNEGDSRILDSVKQIVVENPGHIKCRLTLRLPSADVTVSCQNHLKIDDACYHKLTNIAPGRLELQFN